MAPTSQMDRFIAVFFANAAKGGFWGAKLPKKYPNMNKLIVSNLTTAITTAWTTCQIDNPVVTVEYEGFAAIFSQIISKTPYVVSIDDIMYYLREAWFDWMIPAAWVVPRVPKPGMILTGTNRWTVFYSAVVHQAHSEGHKLPLKTATTVWKSLTAAERETWTPREPWYSLITPKPQPEPKPEAEPGPMEFKWIEMTVDTK
jgi:hypothetical protein